MIATDCVLLTYIYIYIYLTFDIFQKCNLARMYTVTDILKFPAFKMISTTNVQQIKLVWHCLFIYPSIYFYVPRLPAWNLQFGKNRDNFCLWKQ